MTSQEYAKKRRRIPAHRVAYELVHGPIPDGMEILHSCDTPACVNVDHLSPGTQAENIADAASKGRLSRGSNHYTTKLTDEKVIDIRRRFASGEILQKELAIEYGITKACVSTIVNLRNWKHLIE